jgi:hypothetical protein
MKFNEYIISKRDWPHAHYKRSYPIFNQLCLYGVNSFICSNEKCLRVNVIFSLN